MRPFDLPLWNSLSLTQLVRFRTFASSAPSNLLPQMMEQFGFSTEVATLTVSLFIAGYCVGPLVWGPLSEDVSRFLTALTACIYSISLL